MPYTELTHDEYAGVQWVGNPPEWSVGGEQSLSVDRETVKRIQVSKTTHRIRFENETENSVVVVIEPKETNET